jgi:hypothetical protein
MVWRFLVAMAALALVVDGGARAQTTVATQPTVSHPAAPDQVEVGQVCIAIREIHEEILVGRRGKGIEIELGGGACEPPGSGISDISVGFATPGGMEDFAECPAFQTRITKLWAARPHTRRGYGTIPIVRAGPFTVTDSSDLFQLQSPEGRRAAARWINQTLAAVRPCWNKVRQDQTHYVADLLDSDLRRSAPAAIDAAVSQDRRQEYKALHALSPEAQAERDENQQLKAATRGRKTAAADQPELTRIARRPWIEIPGITVNKFDLPSNGQQVRVDITTTLKNVGSTPTSDVLLYIDLMSFSHIQDMTPARVRINSCYHAKENDGEAYRVERTLEPQEEVPVDAHIGTLDAFWPWNLAYNGADFVVAVGCVSYSLGADNARGTSAFAYVIGKKVHRKLVPLAEGDGVVIGNRLSWLRLHQDYEQ